ncbi:MAG: hypothetical protein KGZ53_09060 [Peptococcaceae bacterium]|nr:hypothetical protein [Peptococcaceae bacterium]
MQKERGVPYGQFQDNGINLYHIRSLDYYAGRLFIPLWDGELVVLRRAMGQQLLLPT